MKGKESTLKTNPHFIPATITFLILLGGDIAIRSVTAQSKSEPAKLISAKEFRLVDDSGKPRMIMSVNKNRPSISLFAADGKTPRAVFALTGKDEPVVVLLAKDGKRTTYTIDVDDDFESQTRVRMLDGAGKSVWTAP